MGNVNKVILLGRLGADPETGVTATRINQVTGKIELHGIDALRLEELQKI